MNPKPNQLTKMHPMTRFILLAGLTLASSSAHAALIAHWKFNEVSGTTAVDSAGSNNGTFVGTPTRVTSTVGLGGALDFDGGTTTDAIRATVAGLPIGASARTVSLWLNADQSVLDQKFFAYGTAANGGGFAWTLEPATTGGATTIFFRFNNGRREFTGATIPLDTWTHVAMVVRTVQPPQVMFCFTSMERRCSPVSTQPLLR
jgi:hypothetical protein